MELEVSNRSIPDMRRDFIKYFEDESVFCLIVVKIFFGTTGKNVHQYFAWSLL
jgi:hypothetical protein